MPMGYGANYAEVIEKDFIREICPEELTYLEIVIDEEEYCWDQVAQEGKFGEFENEKVEKAFITMKEAFDKRTGLELYIGYHNHDDEGSCHDDRSVCGMFFQVEGVYRYTEAGEKYKDKINPAMFVTFG